MSKKWSMGDVPNLRSKEEVEAYLQAQADRWGEENLKSGAEWLVGLIEKELVNMNTEQEDTKRQKCWFSEGNMQWEVESFWGDLSWVKGFKKEGKFPFQIMKEQGAVLSRLTGDKVRGDVRVNSKEFPSGPLMFDFVLVAKGLQHDFLLFSVWQNRDGYPVEIMQEDHKDFCLSEEDFRFQIERILSSAATHYAIRRILSQIAD